MSDCILSTEEQLAAEAAFEGEPCESSWPEHAQVVYRGIRRAMFRMGRLIIDRTSVVGTATETNDLLSRHSSMELLTRAEAIELQRLYDCSALGVDLGLPCPIGIAKYFWEQEIVGSVHDAEDQAEARIRETLRAYRIALEQAGPSQNNVAFTVLLASPRGFPPKLIPLVARLEKDRHQTQSVTIYLANEAPAYEV